VINDGNDNTPIAHVRYLASLQLVTTEEEFFCAGVFISRRAVLTLATCFYSR
jgi:V8-like Glu-specific endopeptidase